MCHSKEQAKAQYESITELIERLKGDSDTIEEIHNYALSVQVRSGWESSVDKLQPAEFEILLCTGGPAVMIIGDLDEGQPVSAKLQHQDWFTFWETWYDADEEILLAYASCFYFGE